MTTNNSPEGDGSQRHSGGNQAAGQRGEQRGMLALADTRWLWKNTFNFKGAKYLSFIFISHLAFH